VDEYISSAVLKWCQSQMSIKKEGDANHLPYDTTALKRNYTGYAEGAQTAETCTASSQADRSQ